MPLVLFQDVARPTSLLDKGWTRSAGQLGAQELPGVLGLNASLQRREGRALLSLRGAKGRRAEACLIPRTITSTEVLCHQSHVVRNGHGSRRCEDVQDWSQAIQDLEL